MSLGNSNFSAFGTGGAQSADASQLARWIVQLGICTATANQLINAGDPSSLRLLAGAGPLVEAGAFRQRGGQPCYLMPINPSIAGALGSVGLAGSGNATIAASAAPHVPITGKCIAGGAIGTATFQFSVNGGNFGPTVASVAAAPWVYPVPNTFCSLSFPAATYVAGTTFTVGTNGVVTLGTNWVGNVTQTSSPVDNYEFFLSTQTPGGFGVGQLLVSPDNGPAPTGGGSTLGAFLIPSNGQIVLPGTGVVLQVGQHTILFTITLGGALGTMTMTVAVDGGSAVSVGSTAVNSGTNFVFAVPGTGVTVTFPPGTYIVSDTYPISALGVVTHTGTGTPVPTASWAGIQQNDTAAFLTACAGHSTTDLNNALTAAINTRNFQVTGVHLTTMPSTAAGAVAAQAVLEAAMQSAYTNFGLDWSAWCECPSSQGRGGLGDIVISGGVAIADVADTDTVVAAARGTDTLRTAVCVASYRVTSPLTKFNMARPAGWLAAWMFVRTDPGTDIAAVKLGGLPIFIPAGANSIGRDESVTPALDNVQFNTLRTYNQNIGQAFFSITAGGAGFKNATTQAAWQDFRGVRVLNVGTAQMRPVVQQLLGEDTATNPDGTIEEITRRSWSTTLDSTFKRAVGLAPGGPFSKQQASAATVTVLASSQLGVSPRQLGINYFLQQRGLVSSIANSMYFGGVVPSA
jgi:hypothetical protein